MDHVAALRAICQSPLDDNPRLAYADFLDEDGQYDRAEFIRLQCAIAKLPCLSAAPKILRVREKELLVKNREEWGKDIPGFIVRPGYAYHRGFLDHIRPTLNQFLKLFPSYVEIYPVTDLRLRNVDTRLIQLLNSDHLTYIKAITFKGCNASPDDWIRVLSSPKWISLERLYLSSAFVELNHENVAIDFPLRAMLSSVPNLSRLTHIDLRYNRFGWQVADDLISLASRMEKLQILDLTYTFYPPYSPAFSPVRRRLEETFGRKLRIERSPMYNQP